MSTPNDHDRGAAPHGTEPAHADHDFTGPLAPGVKRLLQALGAICLGLFAIDFFIERTTHAPGEGLPGFYAAYGFIGCVLLVLIAKQMRKVVGRPETYYDDARGPDDARGGDGEAH